MVHFLIQRKNFYKCKKINKSNNFNWKLQETFAVKFVSGINGRLYCLCRYYVIVNLGLFKAFKKYV